MKEASHVDCISCMIGKAQELAERYLPDPRRRHRYMRRVLQEVSGIEYHRTAPYLAGMVTRLLAEETGIKDPYREEKRFFNQRMLSVAPQIEAMIGGSADRLEAAVKMALAGNIIDFGPFSDVSYDMVMETIGRVMETGLNADCFTRLRQSLAEGGHLVYLGDNAGEIVFDKILIGEIKRLYPRIDVTFVTRGVPVLNDVTVQDALEVGMDAWAAVIGNGTDLPGTDLGEVSAEFRTAYEDADVIISKGQGNFESLPGCGKNVFYLFLCKCGILMRRFQTAKGGPVLIHESDL